MTWNYTTKKGDPLPPDQGSAPVGNYLSDKIPAHMSSRPSYNVMMPASGDIIDYCCKLHPNMRGKIKDDPPTGALMTHLQNPRGWHMLQEAISVSILIRPPTGGGLCPGCAAAGAAKPSCSSRGRAPAAILRRRCRRTRGHHVGQLRRGGSFRSSLPAAKSSSRLNVGRRMIIWFRSCRKPAACASKGGKRWRNTKLL